MIPARLHERVSDTDLTLYQGVSAMTINSTVAKPHRKPNKPKKPKQPVVWLHAGSGQWANKIKGRVHYFGAVSNDPDGSAAQEQLNREYPYLREGNTPPAVDVSDGCTLRVLCNEFLRAKEEKLKAGELKNRSFRDYYATCKDLIDHFGKERRVDDLRPDDFRKFRSKLAERFRPVSLKNRITRVCSVFNYASENQLVPKPVTYGSNFERPSALTIRRDRNQGGPKLFERDEVLRILDAADVRLKAMILLAINGGLGNSDVANLPQSALDLEGGWLDYPRVKTEIDRRIPLWPETIAALKTALAERHPPADESANDLCFLTCQGRPWVRIKLRKKAEQTNGEPKPEDFIPLDALGQAFAKVLKKLGINGRRGLGFYSLRHCFETYAGESRDQVAVNAIMGHVDSSMAGNYRHGISDERLQAVVETVRGWLYPTVADKVEKKGG
jgi:integrase